MISRPKKNHTHSFYSNSTIFFFFFPRWELESIEKKNFPIKINKFARSTIREWRDDYYFFVFFVFSSAFLIVSVLYFFRKEHEFTWGLVERRIKLKKFPRNRVKTMKKHRHNIIFRSPSNKTHSSSVPSLLFRFCLLVIPKISYKLARVGEQSRKEFSISNFCAPKWNYKRTRNEIQKITISDMKIKVHLKKCPLEAIEVFFIFLILPFVCRNEIVNIKVGVAVCCPRDIGSARFFSEFK